MYIYENLHPKSNKAPDVSGRGHDAEVHTLNDVHSKLVNAGVNDDIAVVSVAKPENLPDLLIHVNKEQLVAGEVPEITDPEILAESDARGTKNADFVRQVMKRAYGAYEKYAFGMDEVAPDTGRGNNRWAGMAVTMLDSLDTLHLMGLMDEFNRATEWIDKNLHFDINTFVSTFETCIRVLGGLLGAYDRCGNKMYLNKAKDIGDRLLKAFDTPTGLPMGSVNLKTGSHRNAGWTGGSALLAEIGTVQLEYRYLAKHTGIKKYKEVTDKVYDVLRKEKNHMTDGLPPMYISTATGRFTKQDISFGAMGDSYYEYLIKAWNQGGKTEQALRDDYDAAMDGLHKRLLQYSSPSKLAYVAEMKNGRLIHKQDHLACFVPGMLALGAYLDPSHPNAARDMKTAKQLMYTCYQTYERMATGIGAEYVTFESGRDFVVNRAPFYILRPEMVESLFVLHQITKHPIYRDWGHKVMTNIEKYCKMKYAYGHLKDVRDTHSRVDNKMESFFLGETLKYLYLLQDPTHPIDLKKYVFNTEAHPLRNFV